MRSITPLASKKSTRRCPPPQCSGAPAPVHAKASRCSSPRVEEKAAPISNRRTSRMSRRRLWATASARPDSSDGRSTAKFSDSG